MPLNTYQEIPASEPVSPSIPSANYRIGALDQLRIDVFGESELSVKDLPVGENGKIILPLAGEIEAEGLTPAELSGSIGKSLNHYLRNPQVAVNVTQYTSQKVTVEGAVKVPGVFQALHQMTLMDVVALGQGLGDYSKASEIVVFRRQGTQRYAAHFDLTMIQAGTEVDPTILPGDVVVVGYSSARRRFSDIIAVLPITLGLFVALLK